MCKATPAYTEETGVTVWFLIIGIISLLFSTTISCSAQNCTDIPDTFKSYATAESIIKKTKFTYMDQIATAKSSWISGAKYYSCDGKTGFFLMTTNKGKSYLFQDMPLEIWNGFKNADSYGGYYDHHIRNKYQLKTYGQ